MWQFWLGAAQSGSSSSLAWLALSALLIFTPSEGLEGWRRFVLPWLSPIHITCSLRSVFLQVKIGTDYEFCDKKQKLTFKHIKHQMFKVTTNLYGWGGTQILQKDSA
jgi:hypothetical protein